jgi:hypothetical protein
MISLVSAMALVLPAVDAFATIGCYPAGVVTGLITGVTGETTTGITSAAACAVSRLCPAGIRRLMLGSKGLGSSTGTTPTTAPPHRHVTVLLLTHWSAV